MVAQDAIFPHHSMSVSEEMSAGHDARVEHHVGQQRGMSPQPHPRAHDYVCPDVRPFADLCRGVDDRCRMDAGRIRRRPIEKAQRPGKRQVGVLIRRVAASISGNSGSTSTAAALVFRARPP